MGLRRRNLRVAPHEWSVLDVGDGPFVLCLHGAGASAESFSGLTEHLGGGYRYFAPDLPGHGGTRLGAPRRSGLTEMTEDLAALVRSETAEVFAIIGHSAGAALSLALNPTLRPRGHVLINAALESFDGVAAIAFPWLARGLGALPFSAEVMAAVVGREQSVRRLLDESGIEPTGPVFERYLALARSPAHVRGTLDMMGQWDLSQMPGILAGVDVPVMLVVGKDDRVVPATVSERASPHLKTAQLLALAGGHLLHEASPAEVTAAVKPFLENLSDSAPKSGTM